jgi:predicted DNA-binding transcriptional regulator YafY
LRFVERTGRITRKQIAESLGISTITASRDIELLLELGFLIPDGRPGRAAGYVFPLVVLSKPDDTLADKRFEVVVHRAKEAQAKKDRTEAPRPRLRIVGGTDTVKNGDDQQAEGDPLKIGTQDDAWTLAKKRIEAFERANSTEHLLTPRQRGILLEFEETARITRQQVSQWFGISIRTASRDLLTLVSLGRLAHDGRPGKTAGYVLPNRDEPDVVIYSVSTDGTLIPDP